MQDSDDKVGFFNVIDVFDGHGNGKEEVATSFQKSNYAQSS